MVVSGSTFVRKTDNLLIRPGTITTLPDSHQERDRRLSFLYFLVLPLNLGRRILQKPLIYNKWTDYPKKYMN